MDAVVKFLGVIVAFAILIAGLSLLWAWPVQLLINHLINKWFLWEVFGVERLSILQAWGLTILCGLLFKNYNTEKKG